MVAAAVFPAPHAPCGSLLHSCTPARNHTLAGGNLKKITIISQSPLQIRKIVLPLQRLNLPRQKLKTPIEPSQQARFNFFEKNENSY